MLKPVRNRSIQKELLCGFLILFIFFVINVVRNANVEEVLQPQAEQSSEKSAYCLENENGRVVLFFGGNTYTMSLPAAQLPVSLTKGAVRLFFEQGRLRQIRSSEEELTGSIFAEDAASITLVQGEKQIRVEKSTNFQIFEPDAKKGSVHHPEEPVLTSVPVTLYLRRGQAFAGVLKAEAGNRIRILLSTTGHESYYHERVELSCDTGFIMKNGKRSTFYEAGKRISLEMGNSLLAKGTLRLVAQKGGRFTLYSIKRSQGFLKVRGTLELSGGNGGILLINELPFETYLCGVINSEMPEEYGAEALKAQAVCARSYAQQARKEHRFIAYGADLDDTVMTQVYLEQPQKKSAVRAVKSTRGQILWKDDQPMEAFYYAASADAMEEGSPWYRWQITFQKAELKERLKKQLLSLEKQGKAEKSKTDMKQEETKLLKIVSETKKGQVTQLLVTLEEDSGESFLICGEYEIRSLLSPDGQPLLRQDGSRITDLELLPSAFFTITEDEEEETLTIRGSGYGHGNGMSQYGAGMLAGQGYSYLQILGYYFPNGSLKLLEASGGTP